MASTDPDLTFARFFQKVQAPKERALPGSATSEDRDDVAAFRCEGHPFDDFERAEALLQLHDAQSSSLLRGIVTSVIVI
jgi:hypothetical protein